MRTDARLLVKVKEADEAVHDQYHREMSEGLNRPSEVLERLAAEFDAAFGMLEGRDASEYVFCPSTLEALRWVDPAGYAEYLPTEVDEAAFEAAVGERNVTNVKGVN